VSDSPTLARVRPSSTTHATIRALPIPCDYPALIYLSLTPTIHAATSQHRHPSPNSIRPPTDNPAPRSVPPGRTLTIQARTTFISIRFPTSPSNPELSLTPQA